MSEPVLAATHPATFREVMASREYRAVFMASGLSWFGDNAARAAIAAYVLQKTDSIAASAATFAISYLPWLGIGAVLSAVAERNSYRRVMIICDQLRMVLMALVALPGLPVPGMMGLLFVTALLNPPFEAARSALLPRIVDGDRYVVGLAMQKTSGQLAQVLGYLCGASLAAYDARVALLFNAATFGISGFIVGLGVHERPAALPADRRSTLMRETVEGYQVVFRSQVLRAIAVVVFLAAFFSIVPEGLAAGWAAHLTDNASDRGWYQGVIMMAGPVGFVIGGLLVNRLVGPARRLTLIRPFAILTPLALVPAIIDPGLYPVALMNAACGFALAGMLPASNGLFVQALPDEFRARAFGVMQSGIQVVQGVAVFGAGALAERISLPLVVGVISAVGVAVMLLASLTWPRPATITAEVEAARRRNSAMSGYAGTPPAAGHTTHPGTLPTQSVHGQGIAPQPRRNEDVRPAFGWENTTPRRGGPLGEPPSRRSPGAHRLEMQGPPAASPPIARPDHPAAPPQRRLDAR